VPVKIYTASFFGFGRDVDCREWVYQGKEYTASPKAMIIDAIFREVYGGPD